MRKRDLAVATIVASLALPACSERSAAEATEEVVEPTADAPAESRPDLCETLRFIAEHLANSDNRYHGKAREKRLERAVRRKTDPAERVLVLSSLADRRLAFGDVETALERARVGVELARTSAPEMEAVALERMAVIYMRQAEIENCISRHNSDCCIFPLAKGGLHDYDAPAQRALALFIDLARREPDDLSHRWLANLMAMAVDEHPAALPEELRIPLEAFDSEYELPRFRDVAPELGVDVFSLCGGSILEDFDGDGRLDVLTSNSDPLGPLKFFRNDGRGGFADESEEAGLACQLGGLNCLAADVDDDGDADALVLRGAWLHENGDIRNSLLRNDGTGRFEDVTDAAGLAEPAYPTQTAAFGDYDGDGDLDLYVGNETRGKDEEGGLVRTPSQLFLNDGTGTFELAGGAGNLRFAKGVAAGDADNDGDLDIYVSNWGLNRLYENDGSARFRDVAPKKEVQLPNKSFASWFFDWNNDGWLDLFVGGFDADVADIAAYYVGREDDATRCTLYVNDGGSFSNATAEVGLDRPLLPMGANFGDVDGDGWLDVYLATGNPEWESLMPNVLLRNDGGRRFQDATRSAGVGHLQKGHGVSFGDIDDDGDQDLYHQLGGFFHADGYKNALFENPGHGNRFLYVELEGRESNRFGYGARVKVVVETERGEREIHRAVGSVSSFGSTPFRQEIGLGAADRIRALEVRWPATGELQRFEDLPLDARVRVIEGEPDPVRLPLEPIPLGG